MKITDIVPGTLFYESASGFNIEVVALTAPVEVDRFDGRPIMAWLARDTQSGAAIDYTITEGLGAYGPKISSQPEYVRLSKGKITVPIMGGPDIDPDDRERDGLLDPKVLLAWAEAHPSDRVAPPLAEWARQAIGVTPPLADGGPAEPEPEI